LQAGLLINLTILDFGEKTKVLLRRINIPDICQEGVYGDDPCAEQDWDVDEEVDSILS
jgi:hypothetical protein